MAVDTAVLTVKDDALSVCVIETKYGIGLPGTFLHEGELLSEAVDRCLRTKMGITGVIPRQLRVFDAVERDDRGRVISVAHVAVVPYTDLRDVPTRSVTEVGDLIFDHDAILELAVRTIRELYRSTPDPEHLLGETFTIRELHRIHQAIGAGSTHRDTFRRAMLPHLEETGDLQTGSVGKPARVFRRRQST